MLYARRVLSLWVWRLSSKLRIFAEEIEYSSCASVEGLKYIFLHSDLNLRLWCLLELAKGYNFELKYRPGKQMSWPMHLAKSDMLESIG